MIEYFRHCPNKQAWITGVLELSQPIFRTVAVFAVYRDRIEWLAGRGPNLSLPSAPSSRLIIPLDTAGLLRQCVVSRVPYCGPLVADEADRSIYHGFIDRFPEECWIYPAVVGDGVDCLFYVEQPILPRPECNHRFEFLMQKAILAMRRLVIERLLVQGEQG